MNDTAQNQEGERPAPDAPDSAPRRKRGHVILFALLAFVLIALIAIPLYLHERQFESTDDAFIDGHAIQVSPKIAGHVVNLMVDDNQEVAKGDLILEIDPRDYEARLAQKQALLEAARSKRLQAKEQVARAEADLAQAEAEVAAAGAEEGRTRIDLARYESALDVVSRQAVDNARAAAVSAEAQFRAAQQRVLAARTQVPVARSQVAVGDAQVNEAAAELHEAELQLSYTRVLAPDSGLVTRRGVEQGNYVQAGETLLAIVRREVWVTANFRETQLRFMRPGQPVTIRVDAYPDKRWKGRVDSIMAGTGARFSLLPPENATGNYVKVVQRVPVKIVFDEPLDPERILGVGMSVVPRVTVR